MNKLRLIISMSFAVALLVGCSASKEPGSSETSQDNKVWVLGEFKRPPNVNPVISPRTNTEFFCPMRQKMMKWEESDTFNPASTVKDGKIVVLYRAEDNSAQGIGSRTSRIGYAESADGITMSRRTEPVLFPAQDENKELEWPGGCEDPRVTMTEDGLYVMLYTAWNHHRARLAIATSRDLINWEKHGLAFGKAYDGRFKNMSCKSASMVTRIKDGKLVIEKIQGQYFMYWGENAVCAAVSDNLIDWTPVLDENNELKKMATPRDGFFDSLLTECGPPALMTDDGIVLLYNGKNGRHDGNGDPNYPAGAYCAGQFLFDKNDPYKVLDRLDKPFFYPQAPFEKSGQYVDGTVFLEGLSYLNGKLYLYYGCADSQLAVAICDYKR
ncbi:glycoside hydrolase family 130 protein [Prevotella sp. 10(H)]|uniref:glycoside hydrolase family 130 protein n=1 Tax=Prevotella sp. 10(H) TaxID=1158294 RepID=UPI0004A765D6|nr:glycoside hydrolase family 130 protein [Prevotella sp. 10(H)]